MSDDLLSRVRSQSLGARGLVLAGLALILLFAVGFAVATPEYDLGEEEREVAESYNRMGAELGAAIMDNQGDRDNFVFSPTSIGFAFSMAYAGSEGESRDELEEFLNIQMDEETFHESNQEMIASLNYPEPDYRFQRVFGVANDLETNLANGVWVNERIDYQEEYLDLMESRYSARASRNSFDQSTEDQINDWVSDETEGEINEIVDNLNHRDALVLVNAIYFYGDWKHQFEESDTEEHDFHLKDGSTVTVDMMYQDESFEYMERWNEDTRRHKLQAVRLPYGETGRFGMVVLVPDDIDRFVEDWSQEEFEEIIKEMENRSLDLYLPNFEVEYDEGIRELLEDDLGYETIFERRPGDWDGMSEEIEGIDRTRHSAKVEVDEEGTEAAAATSIVMKETMDLSQQMRVDKPFMFLIEDRKTGGILFQGVIQDPTMES